MDLCKLSTSKTARYRWQIKLKILTKIDKNDKTSGHSRKVGTLGILATNFPTENRCICREGTNRWVLYDLTATRFKKIFLM